MTKNTRFIISFLVAVFGFMPVAANAQTVSSPSVAVTRHDDVINKTISDSVTHTVFNDKGVPIADKTYFGADPLPLVFVQGRKGTIDFVPVNAIAEHVKWGMIPDTTKLKSRNEDVRNDGGENHTRKVMEFGFREMDVIPFGNSQSMFTYSYDEKALDNVRVGNNEIFFRMETSHDSRITVAMVDGTKKGRNFLNDPIPTIVVACPQSPSQQADLVLLYKRCGYRFRDAKVDAQLADLVAGRPIVRESEGRDRHQGKTSFDKESGLEDLDGSAINVTINDKDVTDLSVVDCVAGDKMMITLPGKFQVKISQVIDGKVEDKPFFDHKYEDQRWITLDVKSDHQLEVVVLSHGQVCHVQRLNIKTEKEEGL